MLPFTVDGVHSCGDWRINEISKYDLQPSMPSTINSFTFFNDSPIPVRLYFLQEEQWKPTTTLMIRPGESVPVSYVYLSSQERYQVRNTQGRILDEFRVRRNNQTISWSQ